MDLEAMRETALAAAVAGADVVRREWASTVRADPKGLPGDWLTRVDLASEAAIGAFLASATPEISMQGEEGGGAAEGLRWVVDPLDGTTNFVHRFPAVGVSVALVQDDRPVAAAIVAPLLGDAWHAARGAGATWVPPGEAAPVACRVSERPVGQAVVGTGFPFRRKERLDRYLPAFERALRTFEDLRRPGAACLDLAWVASGVLEGFFELALGPWDVAAGILLIEEAGGVVTDWGGGPDALAGDILAGSPGVHDELLRIAGEGS
jgi:myo-inositol-1(or 4)-monophosphatase